MVPFYRLIRDQVKFGVRTRILVQYHEWNRGIKFALGSLAIKFDSICAPHAGLEGKK